jgi:hypothetical protein
VKQAKRRSTCRICAVCTYLKRPRLCGTCYAATENPERRRKDNERNTAKYRARRAAATT